MRGGSRPGAGRPKGKLGPRKQAMEKRLAEIADSGEITPLEILLQTMRGLWAEDTDAARKEACAIARDAAPYVHRRLSSVDMSSEQTVQHVVRVPPKAETAEQWLKDYMQPTVQ